MGHLRLAAKRYASCLGYLLTSNNLKKRTFKNNDNSTISENMRQQINRRNEISNAHLKFIPNCFAEQNGWINNSNFQEVR